MQLLCLVWANDCMFHNYYVCMCTFMCAYVSSLIPPCYCRFSIKLFTLIQTSWVVCLMTGPSQQVHTNTLKYRITYCSTCTPCMCMRVCKYTHTHVHAHHTDQRTNTYVQSRSACLVSIGLVSHCCNPLARTTLYWGGPEPKDTYIVCLDKARPV